MGEDKFKGIRPRRKDMDQWTKVPNEVFEEVMPKVSNVAFKVYCTILRQTYGYKKGIVDNEVVYKEKDQISFSQFQKKTGMSRGSVNNGLKELIEKGYVIKINSGNQKTSTAATYALKQFKEIINPSYNDKNNPQSNNEQGSQDMTSPQSAIDQTQSYNDQTQSYNDTQKKAFKERVKDNNSNTFLKSDFQKIKSTYEELIGRKFTDRLNKKFYELSSNAEDIITALKRCDDYNTNNNGGPPNNYIYKVIETVAKNDGGKDSGSGDDMSDWDSENDHERINEIKEAYNLSFDEDIDSLVLDMLASKDYTTENIVSVMPGAADEYYSYIDTLSDFTDKKDPLDFILDILRNNYEPL